MSFVIPSARTGILHIGFWRSCFLVSLKRCSDCLPPCWGWRLKDKIWSKHRHWHYARGPLTSVLCVLKDLRWQAPEIDDWRTATGDHVRIDFDSPVSVFRVTALLQEAQEAAFWQSASRQKGGRGLENGADLTVVQSFLKTLRDRREEYCAAVAVAQGSLPTQQNGCRDTCPFCGSPTPSLKHMLHECDQLEPSPPAEWLSHLDDCTQQAYWMRGVIPAAWTGIPERVSEGLLEHVEVGGLWAETEKAPSFSLVWMPAEVPVAKTLVLAFVVGAFRPWP